MPTVVYLDENEYRGLVLKEIYSKLNYKVYHLDLLNVDLEVSITDLTPDILLIFLESVLSYCNESEIEIFFGKLKKIKDQYSKDLNIISLYSENKSETILNNKFKDLFIGDIVLPIDPLKLHQQICEIIDEK
jgi:hypothetical protein